MAELSQSWADELALYEVEAHEAPRPTTAGGETILVVEDEELVRRLIVEVLTEQGYVVLPARNGAEALALAAEQDRIDLVLTDLVMPGINGRELAERLAESHGEARVLFMSGYGESVIVHRGVLEPETSFIEKPFTLAALAAEVRATLDRAGPA
ncbi:MAG: response regulator [Gaiellaceae bacterium]